MLWSRINEHMRIYTLGHSNRTREEFLDLLKAHGIRQVVDVRTAPGSRRNPHFMRDALSSTLGANEIGYVHLKELGGFRRPQPDSPNDAWRNESFRGYADYMQTSEFKEALERLRAVAVEMPTAILCSEAVPWRCHRTLIADALAVRGDEVEHIMSSVKANPHRLAPFAAVKGTRLTYPAEPELRSQ